ncbi:MAG: penicillin-binding protein 2 [Candidatus Vogelbacteria bacterium]|nr:penicillin-binding protein 2 [Candidatus Vogelbacteria bacterium]
MSQQKGRIRIRLVLGLVLLMGGLFMVRLFFLQVIKGDYYAEQSDRQYLKSATTFFNRGSIYFQNRKGDIVSAATLKQEFLLTVNPKMIKDKEQVYTELNKVTAVDKDLFMDKLNRPGSLYEEIKDSLNQEEATAIRGLELAGVYLIKEKIRFYPAGPTASHVLGFMAFKEEDYVGRYGLEKYYQPVLDHKETGSFASFFAEIFMGLGKSILSDSPTTREGDLVLSIEPVVQNTVERELKGVLDKWQADSGGVIVMDPNTGAIVAMASYPNFNPNEKQKDITNLPNPIVERVFEMGSVIKPLTMAAGFDAGVIKPETTFEDKGFVKLNGKTIMNHDKKVRGVVPMQTIIDQSMNTGAVFIEQRLGRDTFRKYMLAYGLGEKTGIDLPDEIPGLTRNLNSKEEVNYATVSFGQGIALTPIATIKAFASLANGGKLIEPHVVKEIRYNDGGNYIVQPKVTREVLGRQATDDMTQIMVNAVDHALLNGTKRMERYAIAAKTGTAQMAGPGGKYYDDRFLHSFVGYYPAYQPRFVTLIYMVYPKNGARFASDTLTDPFMNIAKFMINYYELPPDRETVSRDKVSATI